MKEVVHKLVIKTVHRKVKMYCLCNLKKEIKGDPSIKGVSLWCYVTCSECLKKKGEVG